VKSATRLRGWLEVHLLIPGVALLAVVIAIGVTPEFPDILLALMAAVLLPSFVLVWLVGGAGLSVESVESDLVVFHLSRH